MSAPGPPNRSNQPSARNTPAKDPRLLFGAIATRHGFLTEEQILECRRLQDQVRAVGGKPKKLGELLIEKRYLTPAQVQEIFRLQGREGGHRHISGYKLIEKIGYGGMGLVFRAKQLSMDRIVAIKILYPKLAKDTSFVQRFLREARASARLNHINIITGIDVGESNGIYYFAMEFVDGQTVQRILKRGGALDEKRAISICLQIARALDHAHRHGIIHRDIKPDNIMLARDGTAKLCDLGLAKIATAGISEAGLTMGTPNYISPEQARGDANVDGRTDIYGLGATLFHMATGRTPYTGNAAIVMAKHCNDPVPDPRLVSAEVSDGTARTVMQMMAKDPARRHQTPRELAAALEGVLEGMLPGEELTLKSVQAAATLPPTSAAQPIAPPMPIAATPPTSVPPPPQVPAQQRPRRRRRRGGARARRLRRR